MHILITSKENSIVTTNVSTVTSAERQPPPTSDAMKTKDTHMSINNQRAVKNENYAWKPWKDVQ